MIPLLQLQVLLLQEVLVEQLEQIQAVAQE